MQLPRRENPMITPEPEQHTATFPLPASAEYFDLGSYSRKISTQSPDAEIWFNRGLIWCYGFNHEEAAECFEQAIAHDPQCPLAYWGLAYSLGPNYNKPWSSFGREELQHVTERTHLAITKAEACLDFASPVEKALVGALHYRYPKEHPEHRNECSIWNQKYAKAMTKVHRNFPQDLDVVTLYADAIMNLKPWHMWDLRTSKPEPDARTLEVKSNLEKGMARPGGMQHPGLLHLYIHLMEMSPKPETALNAADSLRNLVPDSGHLQHMPSHLDILCGEYRSAILANSQAIIADEKWLVRSGPIKFYTLYRMHNYHFRIYAAMSAGKSAVALDTLAQLENSIPEALLRVKSPPMADWLEAFLGMRVHALIRFGRWQDIIDLELPTDKELYCVTTAMICYAKGVAFAATHRVREAVEQRTLFHDAVLAVPSSRTLFNNSCNNILQVASSMLDGEIAYRKGKYTNAFEHLRRSIALDDALPYDEPWGWMQPTRHAYGALLLEQKYVHEAAAVYAADLGFDDTLPRALRHPKNVWAMHGYHECLTKLGRVAEARMLLPQLRVALAVADVEITSSCFCRLGAQKSRWANL